MAHAATPSALEATALTREPAGKSTSKGMGASLLAAFSAICSGITASHRYETLRARGVPHTEAIDRAFAELGFGS